MIRDVNFILILMLDVKLVATVDEAQQLFFLNEETSRRRVERRAIR